MLNKPYIVRIKVLTETQGIIEGILNFFEGSPLYLEFIFNEEKLNFTGRDFFDCLVKLRESLEERRFFLLCNGARYDVYPSRMTRQMGLGIKAYRMELGKPATIDDIVNIFEETEPSKIGTIKDQQLYYKKWLASLQ